MNGQTLQALRGLLFFSVPEAANMIGQVQERTWRYWEAGHSQVPEDVATKVKALVVFRQGLIDQVNIQVKMIVAQHGEPEDVRLTYYSTLDDWMTQESAEPVCWRPHCAAMAEAAANGAIMVRFNAIAYQAWLNGKQDTPALRAQWAAS